MAAIQGYTSVKEIIERVYDTFDNEDVPFGTLVRHCADALLLIGSYRYFLDKVETINIDNNRGELPCDIIYINQVKNEDRAMSYATDSFHAERMDKNSPDLIRKNCKTTYTINDNHVFTSFKEGKVTIAYRAMKVDSDGFPMIPDQISFKLAVEYHIMGKIAEKLWLLEKITGDKFQYIQQQRDWYIGQAQAKGNMLSMDEMESLKNSFVRLLDLNIGHETFFENQYKKQNLRRHP